MENDLGLELGIGEHLIRISDNEVLQWMQQGIVVQLHISHWRPYVSLEESDLGIKRDATTTNYLQLGRKKLLPPTIISKLESLEMKARSNLRARSFECPWGRFIPASTWQIWKDLNTETKTQFYAIRDELVAALPESIEQLKDIYTKMAMEAYKRSVYDNDIEVPIEFINNFIDHCLSRIPDPEFIRNSFSYTEIYSYIPLLEQVQNVIQGETEAEKEMKKAVAEEMITQKKEMVSDFLAEVSSSLRALVYEACTRVKESIEKNDKLLPGSAKRLVSIMEKVNSLNFYNDIQVEKMIVDITTSLDSYNTSKDVKQVAESITGVLETCNTQLEQIIKWRPSRFGAIEL